MEWLNYHHLRYFYAVAREGSLARAAEKLRVSQPSISEQIHELEGALGEKLFYREGRSNKMTDAGQIVFGYAEEIFALGGELTNAVKQRPGARTLRLYLGIADSFPKLVTNELLKPVFSMQQNVHIICREGKMDDLLAHLAAHRLDIVLADEPASTSVDFRVFNHHLADAGTSFCAHKTLATKLKRGFPASLHQAPAILPAENTMLRRELEVWFRERKIQPRVIAECEDLALMKVMAAEGRGFIAAPDLALNEAIERYRFEQFGRATNCRVSYHAVTAERRILNPAAMQVITSAKATAASKTRTHGARAT